MPSTAASRQRADLLRERIATARKAHAQAVAHARMFDTPEPPDSYLAALGLADFHVAKVAEQTGNRHEHGAMEQLLTFVERELARGWTPRPV